MSSGKRSGWRANLPTRWLTDPVFMDLSACALGTHCRALMFGIEHENDGAIPRGALRLLLPHDCEVENVLRELVESGLWVPTETGHQIVGWGETQTTKAEMERTRKQNAERQRRFQRAKREGNA